MDGVRRANIETLKTDFVPNVSHKMTMAIDAVARGMTGTQRGF